MTLNPGSSPIVIGSRERQGCPAWETEVVDRMAIGYRFEDGYIRFTLAGSFDTADMKGEAEKLCRDAEFRLSLNVLVDNRPSEVVAGSEDIRERVQYLASVCDALGSRVAILVSSTVHYGLARMANFLGDSWQLKIEVFTSERHAIDWLRTGSLPSQSA